MKILLSSIGTRGDMEPFLAIAELLKSKGHDILCLFPEQFRCLADDSGLAFESLGVEFIQMLESDLGKFALGGGGSKLQKILAFIKLARIQQRNNKVMIERQRRVIEAFQPDRIVYNGKVMYPVIWEVFKPGTTFMISPVPYLHYVKGHSHLAFNNNFGPLLNKLTFKLADWGLLKTIMTAIKWLNIKNISKSQINKVLKEHKVIYTISPYLFPRPKEWSSNLKVLGYHERDKTINWQPSPELLEFIEKHSKILFISFGSMTNPEPENKTETILNILNKHQIPAIINTAAGGLSEPELYNRELIHFVEDIPYDWIFPKVYAVMHHGGSGTTHMGLKNGCATMIIPHVIDQFVWNELVWKTGAGPLGIKIGNLSLENLEPKVLDLMKNEEYKASAYRLKSKMAEENLKNELVNELES